MKTEELGSALARSADLQSFFDSCEKEFMLEGLAEYAASLLKKYHVDKKTLIARGTLEKGYAYQILRGTRVPSRDKILQIALAIGCDVPETQRLLLLSGNSELHPRIMRDAVILFCIGKRKDVDECQLLLEENGFPMLRE